VALKKKEALLGLVLTGIFSGLVFGASKIWGSGVWIVALSLAAGQIAVWQIGILRRLNQKDKQIKELEKGAKDIPYLLRLLRNTQKQIDTLLYDLLENWDGLSRDSAKTILKKARAMRPTRVIPPHLLDAYTMNGKIRVQEKYRDSAYPSEAPLFYDKERIEAYIRQIRKKATPFPRYGLTNLWLFEALEKYGIRGKTVAVMGSNKPWYESVCLSYGGLCTTIEYNKILTDHPGLKFLTPDDYDKDPLKFDAALSISSFEHDGLGRFGDPLNPQGDLQAMQKMKSMLKPGGLMYLAVPLGVDTVIWNANRVYGKIRFPLLLEGWKTLETFGFEEDQLERDKNRYEPLFVLENTSQPLRERG